MQKNKGLPE